MFLEDKKRLTIWIVHHNSLKKELNNCCNITSFSCDAKYGKASSLYKNFTSILDEDRK